VKSFEIQGKIAYVGILEVKGQAFSTSHKMQKSLINQAFSLAPQVGLEPTTLRLTVAR